MLILLGLCLLSAGFCHAQYCCAPDQYEGTIQMLQGYATPGHPPGAETDTTMTHFDFTNQREASFSTINAGPVIMKSQVFRDYKQKFEFKFHPDTGKCEKTSLPYPLIRTCPPSSATKLAAEVYGGGKDTAVVDSYSLSNTGLSQMFTFTRDTCLPFTKTMWGTAAGVPLMQFYTYTNLTVGIKDPSVFNLPSACTKL